LVCSASPVSPSVSGRRAARGGAARRHTPCPTPNARPRFAPDAGPSPVSAARPLPHAWRPRRRATGMKQRRMPLPTAAPRINGSAARQSFGRLLQPWWNMLVPVVRPPVGCTWTMGTLAAAAGIAEPTRADPATPSARIAGIRKARPMRMTPPPLLPGPAGKAAPWPMELPGGNLSMGI